MKYVITGTVKNKIGRQLITKPISKSQAIKTKKSLQHDMKIAIPKYKWIKNLRIERRK